MAGCAGYEAAAHPSGGPWIVDHRAVGTFDVSNLGFLPPPPFSRGIRPPAAAQALRSFNLRPFCAARVNWTMGRRRKVVIDHAEKPNWSDFPTNRAACRRQTMVSEGDHEKPPGATVIYRSC